MVVGSHPRTTRATRTTRHGVTTDRASSGSSRKQVFFHIGAPKTGTTYLQHVLLENKEKLAGHGVLYPYDDHGQSFRSMQDFRGVGWGNQSARAFKGEWSTVAD